MTEPVYPRKPVLLIERGLAREVTQAEARGIISSTSLLEFRGENVVQ